MSLADNRILFLSPRKSSPVNKNGEPIQKLRTNMSIPACIIMGILKDAGFVVDFIDAAAENWDNQKIDNNIIEYGFSDETIIDRIKDTQPKYILITSMFTFEQRIVDDLANKIKDVFPNLIIILGGIHASIKPEWHFEESNPDFIVIGEGEESIAELLNELEKSNPNIKSVKGIAFRSNNGKIIYTSSRSYVENSNNKWEIDKILKTAEGSFRYVESRTRKSPVYEGENDYNNSPSFCFYGSRGCPLKCKFCGTTCRSGSKIRHISAQRMFNDFLNARQLYSANVFYNQADTFGYSSEDIQFLQMIKKYRQETGDNDFILNNPNAFFVKIFFPSKNNYEIDTDFIELLKDSGINVVTLAIETITQRFNKKIDFSKISTEKIFELCITLKKFEINIDVYMMYGFPTQTKEEFQNDVKFAEKLSSYVDMITWHFLTLFPGIEYYDDLLIKGYFTEKSYRQLVKNGYNFFLPTDQFNFSKIKTNQLIDTVSKFGKGWV